MTELRAVSIPRFRAIHSDILWALYIAIGFLALDRFSLFERLSVIGEHNPGDPVLLVYAKQLVFVAAYLIAIATIFACLKIRRAYAVPILIALSAVLTFDVSVQSVLGAPASLTNIAVLNGAAANLSDALAEFAGPVSKSGILCVAFFLPLLLQVWRGGRSGHVMLFVAPVGLLMSLYVALLFYKGETVLVGFPKGYSYAFGTLSLKVNDYINSFSPQPRLEAQPSSRPRFSQVIVVIDESIAYDEMAKQLPIDESVVDYGRAYSGANCSATSNLIIRKAGWIRQEGTGKLVVSDIPGLFSLAKKAGYRTAYVDNQGVMDDPSLKNYFDQEEIGQIDQIVSAQTDKKYDRDTDSLKEIAQLVGEENIFILINKSGVHFPYQSSVPPALRTGDKMRDYKTALEVNSTRFLQELIKIVSPEAIVFYTSDHGQDFQARRTHCSSDAGVADAEYAVPYLVVTNNAELRADLQSKSHLYYDKLTHLEFSESVRNSMAYEVDGIDSIFKAPSRRIEETFCGLYGPPRAIFGVEPKCHAMNGSDQRVLSKLSSVPPRRGPSP